MRKYRFKTSLACDIAGVDRAQLNEVISGGYYACAPSAIKGSTRIFDVEQTITLFIFGHMVRLGVSARKAAEWATQLDFNVNQLAGGDGIIGILHDVNGMRAVHTFENGRNLPVLISGRAATGSALAFDVGAIRKQIIMRGDEEFNAPVLGDDDE
jgi:hypothetical protein